MVDLNGDGLLDLVARRSDYDSFRVLGDTYCSLELQYLKNEGNATHPALVHIETSANPFAGIPVCGSFFLFDLDNDGDADLGFLKILTEPDYVGR